MKFYRNIKMYEDLVYKCKLTIGNTGVSEQIRGSMSLNCSPEKLKASTAHRLDY